MRRDLLVVLLVVVIVALATVQFLRTHEQHEETVPVFPGSEAQRHRFLAATRLLEKFGVPAREVASAERESVGAAHRLLVLPAPRGALSAETVRALVTQVEQGAHLIVESEPTTSADPLLDALGVSRKKADFTVCKRVHNFTGFYDDRSFSWSARLESSSLDNPILVDVSSLGEPALKLSLHGGETLSSTAAGGWEASGCEGVRLLHRARGAGAVTAINDISPFTNWAIGRDDNAEVLRRLAWLGGKPVDAVFVSLPRAGLGGWLSENAWRVLIGLGVLVLLWLWRLAPRAGPVRGTPEPVRRRLLDHLRANGRLLWAEGAREALGRAARDAAVARVAQAHPHWHGATAAERVSLLERRFRLPPAWARLFGDGSPPTDVAGFVALIRACRALQRQLHGKDSPSDPLYDSDE